MSKIDSVMEKYQSLMSTHPQSCIVLFGAEVGNGWAGLLETLLFLIKRRSDSMRGNGETDEPFIVIEQIKEKYGELCFYYTGGDNYISELVDGFCALSKSTCESCGSTVDVGTTAGWVSRYCAKCIGSINAARAAEDKAPLPWTPCKK